MDDWVVFTIAVRDTERLAELLAQPVIADSGHEWDEDPAAWVRQQRAAPWRGTG